MSARWEPTRESVRLRNGNVSAVSGATVTVTLDGTAHPGVPVHGPMPANGSRVLLMEQGGSLVVLGDAVSMITELRGELAELQGQVRALIERNSDG